MHTLGTKNKYIGMMFMKMSKEYWALGTKGMFDMSVRHARDLVQYQHLLTHVVTGGMDARYDQVTLIEADTLEEIHAASTAFKAGEKGQYIEVVDVVVGVKAPPRTLPASAHTQAATTNPNQA
jgi:hypothetical protein